MLTGNELNVYYAKEVWDVNLGLFYYKLKPQMPVTVTEGVDGLCVTIDAVNTWGEPVNVQIGEMSTVALSTLTTRTQAAKALTAQGLRIICGGKQFNVMGTQVK